MPATTIWRLPEVMARTGLSRSSIYDKMGQGTFPLSINLGPRTVGWLESEIDQWIDQQIATTRHSRGEGVE